MSLHINMPLLRHFLRSSRCANGADVLRRACADGEPGAISLVLLAIKLRSNRRTRRTFIQVQATYGLNKLPRWYTVLSNQLWRLYTLMHSLCEPQGDRVVEGVSLPRSLQRRFASTGALRVNRLTLKEQAEAQAKELWVPCIYDIISVGIKDALFHTSHPELTSFLDSRTASFLPCFLWLPSELFCL